MRFSHSSVWITLASLVGIGVLSVGAYGCQRDTKFAKPANQDAPQPEAQVRVERRQSDPTLLAPPLGVARVDPDIPLFFATHGQMTIVGYGDWGRLRADTKERLEQLASEAYRGGGSSAFLLTIRGPLLSQLLEDLGLSQSKKLYVWPRSAPSSYSISAQDISSLSLGVNTGGENPELDSIELHFDQVSALSGHSSGMALAWIGREDIFSQHLEVEWRPIQAPWERARVESMISDERASYRIVDEHWSEFRTGEIVLFKMDAKVEIVASTYLGHVGRQSILIKYFVEIKNVAYSVFTSLWSPAYSSDPSPPDILFFSEQLKGRFRQVFVFGGQGLYPDNCGTAYLVPTALDHLIEVRFPCGFVD